MDKIKPQAERGFAITVNRTPMLRVWLCESCRSHSRDQ